MGKIKGEEYMEVRGFEVIEGADCDEKYAPVSHIVTLSFLISLAAHDKWFMELIDVRLPSSIPR